MNAQQPEWIAFAKIIKDLISENIWALIVALFIFFARDGIGYFVKRLVNFDFSFGSAKGSLKAQPLPQTIEQQSKDSSKEEKPTAVKTLLPEEEGEKESWFTQVMKALRSGQKEEAERVFEKYISTVTDPLLRIRRKSAFLYFTYSIAGDRPALEKLQNMFKEAENSEHKAAIAFWLSDSYRDAKNTAAEKGVWETLLDIEFPEKTRANFIINLSSCLEAEKKIDDACSLVEINLNKMTDSDALGLLFNKLGLLQKERGNKLLAAVAYEKALQYQPDDKDILFSAAYAQGDTDLQYLSYFNYDTLVNLFPESDSGYNNLGVGALNLGMNGKSVDFYRRAIEKENTLAMSNIAYLYISKGFYEEAKIILQKALGHKEPHQNVCLALSELEKIKQEEKESHKKALDSAVMQREFVRNYSEARFMATMYVLNNDDCWYTDSDTEIKLSLSGNKVIASWEETSGLAITTKRKRNISALLTNRALTGKYSVEGIPGATLLSYEPTKTRNFIAYFRNDSAIHMMFIDKDDPMFMVLVKKPSQIEGTT